MANNNEFLTMNLKSTCLAAVHTDDFSLAASFSTGGNSVLTIDITVLDGWIIGAKGAESTLTSTIEFGRTFITKEIFASCAFTFRAHVSEKKLNWMCEHKMATM